MDYSNLTVVLTEKDGDYYLVFGKGSMRENTLPDTEKQDPTWIKINHRSAREIRNGLPVM